MHLFALYGDASSYPLCIYVTKKLTLPYLKVIQTCFCLTPSGALLCLSHWRKKHMINKCEVQLSPSARLNACYTNLLKLAKLSLSAKKKGGASEGFRTVGEASQWMKHDMASLEWSDLKKRGRREESGVDKQRLSSKSCTAARASANTHFIMRLGDSLMLGCCMNK